MNQVTIVMYHYVRPLKKSKYPKIKGLELTAFKGQLAFFQKHYQPVTMEEVISAVKYGTKLPSHALLLTFDDGYQDHYQYVFPILLELGWQGSFFSPGITLFEHKVLDANKIHFILAAVDDIELLVTKLIALLKLHDQDRVLPSGEDYYRSLAISSRFDDKNVMFIKRMLQKKLPLSIRNQILDTLFKEYVSEDEDSFARELYLTLDQLRQMKQKGMFVGGHSHAHGSLTHMNQKQQLHEIKSSLNLLKTIGAATKDWVMCYPYGEYDDSLLSLLKKNQCAVGVTVKVGIADLDKDDPLQLPRFDTNDFPIHKNAPIDGWT